MKKLDVFFKLAKVDTVNRLVYGVLAQEVADGQREIMDYDSSKPEFEKWSGDIAKASDGKSLGNVRAMHGKVAAGRLDSLSFDDVAKSIEGVAHIVDDNEWEKVEKGVYTGFSIGGKYGKTWKDPTDPLLKRYTAIPGEVSLVDKPCIPTATFSLIKADGVTEERTFLQPEPAEPKQVWQAKDGTTFEKKADAIAHDEGKTADPAVLSTEAQAALDLANQLGKALDKTEGKQSTADRFEKSMYDVSRCASICSDLKYLSNALLLSDSNAELKGIIGTLGEFLKKLVEEEVTALTAEKMETFEMEKLEKLSPFSDLVKAAFEAKKKKKKEDDDAAEDDEEESEEEVEKLQKMANERDILQKALVEITPKLQAALDRIEKLEQQPQPAKGVVRAVSKSEDNALSGAAGQLQKALDSGPVSPEQARAGVAALLEQAAAK